MNLINILFRNRYAFLYIVFACTILALACLVTATSRHPNLSPSQSYLNLGPVLQNTTKSVSIELRNSYDRPVRIRELDPSCGCTAINASALLIAPGKSTRIDLAISPGTRIGRFSAFALIKWELVPNSITQTTRIDLAYDSVRLIKTQPEICTFNQVDADHPSLVQFELDRGEAPLSWSEISIFGSKLDIYRMRLGQDRFLAKVYFPLDKFPIGIIKDKLNVSLLRDNKVVGTAIIPFEARLTSELSLEPDYLYLGAIPPGVSQRGKFVLKSMNSKLTFTSISSSIPGFIGAAFTGEKAHEIAFSYSTIPTSSVGARVGNLLITVDAARKRQLLLPFIGYVK